MSIADTFDLAAAFVEAEREREEGQTYPPGHSPLGHITVEEVIMYSAFPAYQNGRARLNLDPGDLQQGENVITLKHILGDVPATEYAVTKYLFKDTGPTPPTPTAAPVVVMQPISSSKWLSGIRFYSIDDQLNISFGIDEAFDNTFIQNVAHLLDSGFGMGNESIPFTLHDLGYNLVDNIPSIGSAFTITDLLRSIDQTSVFAEGARLGIRGQDPHGNSEYLYSATTPKILVNTYSANSTSLVENFRDEVYRLPDGAHDTVPSPINGVWDSTAALPDPAAQVWGNTLVYPTKNFLTGYEPAGPDYSGREDPQPYVRAYYKALASKGGGILKIPPLIMSDLSSNVKVEVKLPTQTGWMDLGVAYDPQTFDGSDGQGCLFSSSGDEFTWSCGGFRTLNSGSLIMVRVSMKTAVKELTSLSEVGW